MNKVLSILLAIFCFTTFQSCYLDVAGSEDEFFLEHSDVPCIELYRDNHKTQNLNYTRTIYLDTNTVTDEHVKLAKQAVHNWNQLMNYDLFTVVTTKSPPSEPECGSIIVRVGDLEKNYIGYAWWNSCKATVKIEPGVTSHLVYMHEFGHSINLDHEEMDKLSVMYPSHNKEQVVSELSKCLVKLSIWESEEKNGGAAGQTEALSDRRESDDVVSSENDDGKTCFTE